MATNFSSKQIIIGVVIFVALLCCFSGCSTYNNLVNLDENVENAWGNVQNQYQRRLDLIPNLVRTVDAYAKHERETFENVTKARAGLMQAQEEAKALSNVANTDENALDDYSNSQAQLNKAFSIYVNAVHEAYPDLKANENFRDLQTQLEGTENRIATERTRYNDVVNEYNKKVRRFPGNIWAGMFGFDRKPMFRADSEAQSAPKVDFGN